MAALRRDRAVSLARRRCCLREALTDLLLAVSWVLLVKFCSFAAGREAHGDIYIDVELLVSVSSAEKAAFGQQSWGRLCDQPRPSAAAKAFNH